MLTKEIKCLPKKKNDQNWEKMSKTGKKCFKLRKNAQNWKKMLKTGKNHPKMKKTKGIISARGNEGACPLVYSRTGL